MSHGLRALPWGLGLVEGFYGRSWSASDRLAALGFLGRSGYRYYVYAPKSDGVLRRDWRGGWDALQQRQLRDVADSARANGVVWGVGLSPLGLVEQPDAAALRALRAKLAQLDDLGVQLLCVLFDDMPRNVDDLAERQVAIIGEVAATTRARHLLVCPSYYCRDPVLERLFGKRPAQYWRRLGEALPAQAGVFWTGEHVCSTHYPEQDLQEIAGEFGRAPVLWDNYPVNDGARMADFLRIDAFRNRPASLRRLTGAHFANPMNQCWLSRIPLQTLPRSYAEGEAYDADGAFADAARALAGAAGGALLVADRALLQQRGLAGMDEAQRRLLRDRYAAFDAPWAQELRAWLDGEFAFDPACLTG